MIACLDSAQFSLSVHQNKAQLRVCLVFQDLSTPALEGCLFSEYFGASCAQAFAAFPRAERAALLLTEFVAACALVAPGKQPICSSSALAKKPGYQERRCSGGAADQRGLESPSRRRNSGESPLNCSKYK